MERPEKWIKQDDAFILSGYPEVVAIKGTRRIECSMYCELPIRALLQVGADLINTSEVGPSNVSVVNMCIVQLKYLPTT